MYIYISEIIIITVQVARFCVALVCAKDNTACPSRSLARYICLCAAISVHCFRPFVVNNALIFHISLFSCLLAHSVQGRVNASASETCSHSQQCSLADLVPISDLLTIDLQRLRQHSRNSRRRTLKRKPRG